jgi:hypothetical protein
MAAQLFISYSHADNALLERLHKHLAQLQRDGSLSGWYDREIQAGGRLDSEIELELGKADIFLACVSPDYIASNYCYDKELQTALERESKGELAVVPVIFEPCEWLETPLQKFKAVPRDGKAVSEHTNPNVAFLDVATELRRLATSLTQRVETKALPVARDAEAATEPTSSRYRIKRDHDELHRRDFIEASFNEIYRFFESSVGEIASVPDIEARLTTINGDHFSCTVINRGLRRGFETLHVRRGGSWGAIDILYGERNSTSTSNGGFGVDADEYQLYLKPTMFNLSQMDKRVTAREAAQMLWDDLLRKVGIDYA